MLEMVSFLRGHWSMVIYAVVVACLCAALAASRFEVSRGKVQISEAKEKLASLRAENAILNSANKRAADAIRAQNEQIFTLAKASEEAKAKHERAKRESESRIDALQHEAEWLKHLPDSPRKDKTCKDALTLWRREE